MAITITHEHPSRRTALSVVIAAVVAATVIAVAVGQLTDDGTFEPRSSITSSAEVNRVATHGPNADLAPVASTGFTTQPAQATHGPNADLAPLPGR